MPFRIQRVSLPVNGSFHGILPDGTDFQRTGHTAIAIRFGIMSEEWKFIPEVDLEKPDRDDSSLLVLYGASSTCNHLNGCGCFDLDLKATNRGLPGRSASLNDSCCSEVSQLRKLPPADPACSREWEPQAQRCLSFSAPRPCASR